MRTVLIEKRQRGVFSRIFTILFWSFNAVMFIVAVGTWVVLFRLVSTSPDEGGWAAIATLAGGIGVAAAFKAWFQGVVILGLMMFATRGQKEIILTKSYEGESNALEPYTGLSPRAADRLDDRRRQPSPGVERLR